MDNSLRYSLVQHLLVPLLQAFWLRDLLVLWVTVEDVVVAFTGRTGPDMTCCESRKTENKWSLTWFIKKKSQMTSIITNTKNPKQHINADSWYHPC